MPRLVDLHLHSTASDGQEPPAGVVEAAAVAGLEAIALTDHDTVDGLPEAVAAGTRLGIRVIAGCEFSVSAPWGELHILGYFLPIDSEDIQRFLADRREDRRRRAGAMVAKLGGQGVSLSMEDVERVAAGAALGRPHVARALLEGGLVESIQEAFDRFLGWGRPAFEPKQLPELAVVARLVHSVGGVVSAAHLKDRGTRANLERLRADGLDAVEVRHPRHPAAMRDRLASLATATRLAPTGGSDWHGDGFTAGTPASIGSQNVPAAWLAGLEERRRTS